MSANPIQTVGKMLLGGVLGPAGGAIAGTDAVVTGAKEVLGGLANAQQQANPGAPPETPTSQSEASATNEAADKQRRRASRGRSANLLTGAGGASGAASTTGRTLLGY